MYAEEGGFGSPLNFCVFGKGSLKEEIKERGEEKKRLKKERKREFGERKGETSK